MKALLSIKPEFVDKIFDGSKRYEFRKTGFKRDVSVVVVYATKPVCKIVGEFDVSHIVADEPENLWRETANFAGVSKDFFSEYFSGRDIGYAIVVKNVRRYDREVDPYEDGDFIPPQSFRYLPSVDA